MEGNTQTASWLDRIKSWANSGRRTANPAKAYGEALDLASKSKPGSETQTKALAAAEAERQKLIQAKQLGSAPLKGGDGVLLEWPGEYPAVGDPATVVNVDGSTAPAPAGVHETESGWIVEVDEQGVIVAVTEPQAAAADPAADAALSKGGKAEPEPADAPKERRLAATPLPVRHAPTFLGRQGGDERKWVEGAELLLLSKSRNKKVRERFQVGHDRVANYAIGADLTGLTTRALNYLSMVAYEARVNSSILELMNRVNVDGLEQVASATGEIEIDIPRMQITGAAWRKDSVDCTFDPRAIVSPSRRTIRMRPGILDMELCPKNWRGLFNRVMYVNDTRIPAESIILEMILAELNLLREQQILTGAISNANNYFDGLSTLLAADVQRPAVSPYNIALAAPTATTGVDEVKKMINVLPLAEHNVHRNKPHTLMVDPLFAQHYLDDFFQTYSAAAEGYDDYLKPIQLTPYPVKMATIEGLSGTNRAYLVPDDALYYAVARENTVVREDPRTRTVLLSIEETFGMNYAFGTQIIQGTW